MLPFFVSQVHLVFHDNTFMIILSESILPGGYQFHVYFYVRILLHRLIFPYRMKMVLVRLKILILKAHTTVFVMIMVLLQIKYG